MRRVFAVALGLLAILSCPKSAPADSLHYVDRLEVVDATGRRIGFSDWEHESFARSDWYAGVALMTESGDVWRMSARPEGWGNGGPYFSSSDCTGTPRIMFGLGVSVGGPRDTAYLATGPAQWGYMFSRLVGAECVEIARRGDAGAADHEIPGYRGFWAPAAPVLDLRDYFEPPFTLRARGTRVAR